MSKSTNSDHNIKERVSETAHESMEQMGKAAARTKDRLQHEAGLAKARAKQAGQQARERSDEALDSVNTFVGDNPITSLGIAFAAGSLVSYLIKR